MTYHDRYTTCKSCQNAREMQSRGLSSTFTFCDNSPSTSTVFFMIKEGVQNWVSVKRRLQTE